MRRAKRRGVKFLREVRFAAERAFRGACSASSAASGAFHGTSCDCRVGVSGPARPAASYPTASPSHGASERSAGNRSMGLFRIACAAADHLDSGTSAGRVFVIVLIFLIGCIGGAIHRTVPFDS